MTEPDARHPDVRASVSVGAGIAIAAVWLVGGGLTGLFAWLTLGLEKVTAEGTADVLVLIALIAAPLAVAVRTTREVLYRDG